MTLLGDIRREARGDKFVKVLTAGVIIGFFESVFAISLAGLVFSGSLQGNLSAGIGMMLMTVVIMPAILGLLSGMPGMIANIQENPLIVLNVAVVSFLAGTIATPDNLLPTVLVLISASTVITGLCFYLLAHFNLTGLVRYIPYPVIGGFLAGTGWLAIQGSVGTMAEFPLNRDTLPQLIETNQLILWVPGLFLGVGLSIFLRRISHFLAMPGFLITATVGFYVIMVGAGVSIDAGIEQGLLLGDIGGAIRWQPLNPGSILAADWLWIISQSGTIVTAIVIALVNIILFISGIEVGLNEDLDINQELKANGITNMISGAMGGAIGFPSVSMTALNARLDARGRLTGIVAGIFSILIMFAGSDFLVYVPKAVLGSLLVFLGYEFISDWIIAGFRKFSWVDYGIVWVIVLAIGFIGFLEGVAIGLFVTVMVFVVNYSRTTIFYRIHEGTELSSNVEWSQHFTDELKTLMREVYIIELQGFLFFGTATALLEAIQHRTQEHEFHEHLSFIILDFHRVQGVDASAALNFSKALQLAANNEFTLVFTGIPDDVIEHMPFLQHTEEDDRIHLESNLDFGIAYCERELLNRTGVTEAHIPAALHLQLRDMGMPTNMGRRLQKYLETKQLKEGEYLIKQGEEATGFYFVQIGQVSVILEAPDGERIRLRTMTMGTIVGELGYFLKLRRSASVVTDMTSMVHYLSEEAAERMREEDPELTTAFMELMVKITANRLVRTNQSMATLYH